MSERYCTDTGKNKSKKNVRIHWGFIAFSFAFIFNPNITIVDIFPDFIGYMILSASLLKLSMLSETLADSRRSFERMIFIDVAKILALLWVFGIESSNERSFSLLMWTFVFGVAEVIFLASAFVKLFSGFEELGNLYSNSSIHGSKRAGGKSYTEKAKSLSVFFVVMRAVLALLPELSALGSVSYDKITNSVSLYRYIGVMRGICFIPVMILGIFWLVRICRYFARIRADRQFCDEIDNACYKRFVTKQGAFTIRNVKLSMWFFVVAMVLSLDIRMNGTNIFPDLLVPILLIPSLMYMSKTTHIPKAPTLSMMTCYGMISVLSVLAENYYLDNYTYNAMAKSSEAFIAFMFYIGAVAVKSIIFICLVICWYRDVRKVIVAHTGYVLGRETLSEKESMRIAEDQKEVEKGFVWMADAAMLYVLSDVAYALYGAFYAFLSRNFGWLGLLNFMCGIFFVAMAAKASSELSEAVQTKYMLE